MDKELLRQLYAQFGKGDDPVWRQRLFSRLSRIVLRPPSHTADRARKVIQECRIEAREKKMPGRWFSVAVLARLQEEGLIPDRFPRTADTVSETKKVLEGLASSMDSTC